MNSTGVIKHMTACGNHFDKRDLVALEPWYWHDMESQIGSEFGFGAALLVVKWTDGKDTAVIYKHVLAHLSSKQKEDAEQSIMKVTEQKEQEREGLGALQQAESCQQI